jgi:hypothetical protein
MILFSAVISGLRPRKGALLLLSGGRGIGILEWAIRVEAIYVRHAVMSTKKITNVKTI